VKTLERGAVSNSLEAVPFSLIVKPFFIFMSADFRFSFLDS